ncbi:aldolase C-2 [Pelomyxa schiedti]|nr:aldolase C-2 [Pelomyxa schiedti]
MRRAAEPHTQQPQQITMPSIFGAGEKTTPQQQPPNKIARMSPPPTPPTPSSAAATKTAACSPTAATQLQQQLQQAQLHQQLALMQQRQHQREQIMQQREQAHREVLQTMLKLAVVGKGFLLCDEGPDTQCLTQQFSSMGLTNSAEIRGKARDLIATTDGLNKFICGVVLTDEVFAQRCSQNGRRIVDVLRSRDIAIGVVLDRGVHNIPGFDIEECTQGLDDLGARCTRYYGEGARFAKWKTVFYAGNGLPTQHAIDLNTTIQAQYAAVCQESGLVPMIDAEVIIQHSIPIEESATITETIFTSIFGALQKAHVLLEGIIFRPTFVTPGPNASNNSTPAKWSETTLQCLARTVPPAVQCVMLSSNMTDDKSLELLRGTTMLNIRKPWTVGFAFGTPLLHSFYTSWAGKPENAQAAQNVLLNKCSHFTSACLGVRLG